MISLASADHFQIVTDEEIGEAAPLLQIAQKIDDLRLHRHVERRGRLVEDDEFRLKHSRPGDRDALPLPAGKFVRIAVHRFRVEAGVGKRLRHDFTPPRHLDIHGIADNHATHKKHEVKDGLAKHPRFHMRFIPTASSWLNLVERWFGQIPAGRIRRGVFKSVPELERAIDGYIAHNNADPKPFVRTKSASAIILKVNRGRAALKIPPLARQNQL